MPKKQPGTYRTSSMQYTLGKIRNARLGRDDLYHLPVAKLIPPSENPYTALAIDIRILGEITDVYPSTIGVTTKSPTVKAYHVNIALATAALQAVNGWYFQNKTHFARDDLIAALYPQQQSS